LKRPACLQSRCSGTATRDVRICGTPPLRASWDSPEPRGPGPGQAPMVREPSTRLWEGAGLGCGLGVTMLGQTAQSSAPCGVRKRPETVRRVWVMRSSCAAGLGRKGAADAGSLQAPGRIMPGPATSHTGRPRCVLLLHPGLYIPQRVKAWGVSASRQGNHKAIQSPGFPPWRPDSGRPRGACSPCPTLGGDLDAAACAPSVAGPPGCERQGSCGARRSSARKPCPAPGAGNARCSRRR